MDVDFRSCEHSTSTTCRHCGERFRVLPRAGRNTKRRQGEGRKVSYPFARYCSSRCRKAASRKRSSAVTLGDGGIVPRSAVTLPAEHIENISEFSAKKTVLGQPKGRLTFWRWYKRLDGSSDLYCDTQTAMRHMARIVRRDGHYCLVKPSDLTSAVWADLSAAQHAVRNLVRK